MSKHMCGATAPRPGINDPDHQVTIRCFRRDGHPGLHFDAAQGDWAEGDTEARLYSVRDHILRAMDPATEFAQSVYEQLLDEFQREWARGQGAPIRVITDLEGRSTHFRGAAEFLRTYPEYRGTMELAAQILEQHATMPHVYTSWLCTGNDHLACGSSAGYGKCKACEAPCSCECHGGRS